MGMRHPLLAGAMIAAMIGAAASVAPLAARGTHAVAKANAAAPASAAPVAGAPAAPDTTAQIDDLRQRLSAARQTIATLDHALKEAQDKALLYDQCRAKNGRMVAIARDMVRAYDKRYQAEHKDPLQSHRRDFEYELQDLSDAIYENRAEVPPPPGTDKPVATLPTPPNDPALATSSLTPTQPNPSHGK